MSVRPSEARAKNAGTASGSTPSDSHNELAGEVLGACRALGFAAAGIAPAAPTSRRAELLTWLSAGRHGEMSYLEAELEERLDIGKLLPGARAVIVVADQYASRSGQTLNREVVGNGGTGGVGRIARYAQGRDYHAVIRRRLHSLADALRARFRERSFPRPRFRAFVDTGPVLEREHAARAGLGWIGKHTLLIHPRLGSYLLLGGIATTLELVGGPSAECGSESVAEALPVMPVTDHCGGCTRCIDACPTRAITPYSVDATRCISYLTLEHQSLIDPRHHHAMGDWILGCDICQDVCPHNAPLAVDHLHESARRSMDAPFTGDRVNPALVAASSSGGAGAAVEGFGVPGPHLDLLAVLDWSEHERREALSGSAAKRASLEMIRRNVVIAAGNALRDRRVHGVPAARLRDRIQAMASDAQESPLVRETAVTVWASMGEASGFERAARSPQAGN